MTDASVLHGAQETLKPDANDAAMAIRATP
jgi:hypothetical protein